jgi:hypothetical protein
LLLLQEKASENLSNNKVICKVTLSFTRLFPFSVVSQGEEIWLNLSMKCRISTSNAQGSRVIIVIVQVGVVKIYVAAVEALKVKTG